jgi:hypothetical protein
MATTRRLLLVLLVAAAIAFGWFDVRQRARLDRGLSRHRTDFTVYTSASRALFAGEDPYEARSPRGWRYVYPPLLAIVVRPLLALPVEDAATVWYGLSALALALAVVATARAIGPPAGSRAAAVAALLCAGFLVQTFQRGQVTVLLLALQAGAILAFLRGRDLTAGLLLAAGVALRLTPLLLAGMIGMACLRRLLRGEGARAWRFPAGLAAGLLLGFVVLPVAALGPSRAREVTERWVASGREVYAAAPGALADLRSGYAVNEDSFKNQGVRRVLGTWTAWATGAAIDEDGRPDLGGLTGFVDGLSFAVALAVLAWAAALGWRRVGSATPTEARAALALGALLPVLVTRYAWPVHYVVALPFLAECVALGRRGTTAVLSFAVGTALFYAAHAAQLRPLGEAGVLLVGALDAIVLARLAARSPSPPEGAAP